MASSSSDPRAPCTIKSQYVLPPLERLLFLSVLFTSNSGTARPRLSLSPLVSALEALSSPRGVSDVRTSSARRHRPLLTLRSADTCQDMPTSQARCRPCHSPGDVALTVTPAPALSAEEGVASMNSAEHLRWAQAVAGDGDGDGGGTGAVHSVSKWASGSCGVGGRLEGRVLGEIHLTLVGTKPGDPEEGRRGEMVTLAGGLGRCVRGSSRCKPLSQEPGRKLKSCVWLKGKTGSREDSKTVFINK